MITAISINETVDYVSKFDKDEPKTIWKIATLNSDIFGRIETKLSNNMEAMIEVVKFGLKDFAHFKDRLGNDLKPDFVTTQVGGIDYKVLSNVTINALPIDLIIELGGLILKNSKLTEEEQKNS